MRRSAYIDNARWALIALVVLGHLLELVIWKRSQLLVVYRSIYLVHIPALIFLSGAVCSSELSRKALSGVVSRLLVPLAVFQFAAWLLDHFAWWPGPRVANLDQPWWLLWYLAALAAWRVLLPLFDTMKVTARWTIAILLSLVAGFLGDLPPTTLRILVFLPVFMAGHYFFGAISAWGEKVSVKIAAAGILCCVVIFMAMHNHFDMHWLYGNTNYGQLRVTGLEAVATRAVHLAAVVVASVAFLILVPRRDGIIATAGQYSISAYILHGFLLKAVSVGLAAILLRIPWPVVLTGSAVVAAAVSLVLSRRTLSNFVMMSWLSSALVGDPHRRDAQRKSTLPP